MAPVQTFEPRILLRDAAVLAMARVEAVPALAPRWGGAEAEGVRRAAAHLRFQRVEAAHVLAPSARRLVTGIKLVPFLAPGGPFGPAWPAHPLASPAWFETRPLREPDATRGLAAYMSPAAGPRGPERARSFLRVLTELAGANHVRDAVSIAVRPNVVAEQEVTRPPRRGQAFPAASGRAAAPRIDLLFDWPVGDAGARAVVVVEAKLGATVGDHQLHPYRVEARRLARGGPVALILLTAVPDAAERRHRAWKAVRWFALLRRWEVALAEAGDADPEFARLRANLWRFVLDNRKALR